MLTFVIVQKVDSMLRRLHQKGFVFCDFHFDNIESLPTKVYF